MPIPQAGYVLTTSPAERETRTEPRRRGASYSTLDPFSEVETPCSDPSGAQFGRPEPELGGLAVRAPFGGLEQEQLEGDVRVVRDLGEERPDLAAGGLLDDLDEVGPHPVLEHHPRLAYLREGTLGDHPVLDG